MAGEWVDTLAVGTSGSAVEPGDAIAALVAQAWLLDSPQIVHRRVESFEILDDISVQRFVSLELTVPNEIKDFGVLAPNVIDHVPFTPVTTLTKGPKLNFSLRDEDDRLVPVLTKAENGRVSATALIFNAETLLGIRCPCGVDTELRTLTQASAADGSGQIKAWYDKAADTHNPEHTYWQRLTTDGPFMDFAQALAENWIMLAAIAPSPGDRRLLRFTYEEEFGDDIDVNRLQRLSVRLGWRHKTIRFETPAVSTAASFHVEATTPSDLELLDARMQFSRRDPLPAGTTPRDPPKEPVSPPGARAHLYVERVDQQFVATVLLFLRARRAGFLRGAFITALLVVGLLAGGVDRTRNVVPEPGAAVLVITPTILAALILQPGEHHLATRMLVGVRATVLAATACAIAAAMSLAVGASGSPLHLVWWIALGIAIACALILSLSNLLPRPKKAS